MSVTSPGAPLRAVLVGSDTNGQIGGVASGSAHAPVNCAGYTNLVVYVKASAALSDGTLIIEERDLASDAAGQIASITLATPFASAGGTYAYHLQNAAYGYVNARIGTTVVGGTITAVLRAC